MYKFTQFGILLAGLLAAPVVSLAADSSEHLLEQLRSDHAAMMAAEQDFRGRRERGTLSGNEAADYAGYVAGLYRRVAVDCVALAENGVALPADLTCPEETVALIAPVAIDQANELTDAESMAILDAELQAGLGEFDEMLLREQERIKAAMPRADAGSAGGGGGGAGGGAVTASGSEQTTFGTGAQTTTYGEGAGPGTPGTPGKSSAPPGTPDGSDDDVVARQLREAAEKETDPELKKKLWEEYRKYKEGTF